MKIITKIKSFFARKPLPNFNECEVELMACRAHMRRYPLNKDREGYSPTDSRIAGIESALASIPCRQYRDS